MKKTKKLLAAALAAALLAVMAVPAFATTGKTDTLGNSTKTATHDVTGTYQAGGADTKVYSVDIEWGSMAFTYYTNGTWNPETHQNDAAAETGWTCDTGANVIKVTNHSNAQVSVKFAYEAETSYGISGSFTGNVDTGSGSYTDDVLALNTAVGTQVASAPHGTATLTLSGALDSTTVGNTKIGTVTVKLQDDAA